MVSTASEDPLDRWRRMKAELEEPQPRERRLDTASPTLDDIDRRIEERVAAEHKFMISSVRLKLEQFQLPVGDKVVFDRIDALEGLLQRQFLEERQRQNL